MEVSRLDVNLLRVSDGYQNDRLIDTRFPDVVSCLSFEQIVGRTHGIDKPKVARDPVYVCPYGL